MKDNVKVYLASGWFNERDDRILTSLENTLSSIGGLTVYRPRKDGVKLSAEDFHDHNLRKKVFESNVENIDSADFLVVNLDCGSPKLDTGTVWECARAVALGIPVLVYDETNYIGERMKSISTYIPYRVNTLDKLKDAVKAFMELNHKSPKMILKSHGTERPLVLCDVDTPSDMIATMLDTTSHIRVIPDPPEIDSSSIESLFDNTNCVVIATDTKDPILTWYMSIAYALGVPIFTYSATNAPLNLMLIFSVVKHIVTLQDLSASVSLFLHQGISAFDEYDTSNVKVY